MQKYINFKNDKNYEKLKEPARLLKNGGVVIFPTETVYGIGANAFNATAVKKLYDLKNRDYNKPISLLVSNINMVNQVARDIAPIEYALMEEFFPGPLTIILKKKSCVPDIVVANGESVGVRMPSNEIAKKLIELANMPLATPSANISGKPSGTNMSDILRDFDGKVDCIIDGGCCEIGVSSTIVEMEGNIPHILRKGSITEEMIQNVIKKFTKRLE